MTFNNLSPIIPGFYPDPTMCSAPDGLYLANSSFELFPGAPVFHSRDGYAWRQVGNVLNRTDQVDLRTFDQASSGIYGSTLRFHDNKFWFITTNIAQSSQGQLLFTSESAEGPWSDPILIEGVTGIDPDIAWTEKGECFITWCSSEGGIAQVTIDPNSGKVQSETRRLWSGTGMKYPEGPHLYHHDGWWYLVIAEGGTERGHCVSVARSRRPDGGFESNPANPILTHRSTAHPVQSVGHLDLAEHDGRWLACYHGARPQGWTPEFHVLGRETMLCGVQWVDGWPVIDESDSLPQSPDTSLVTRFNEPLEARWVSPGGDLSNATVDGALHLSAGPLVGIRAQDLRWRCEADVDPLGGTLRFAVHLDDNHWFAIEVTDGLARGIGRSVPFEQEFGRLEVPPGSVTLAIQAVDPTESTTPTGPDSIELIVGGHTLCSLDGRHLSTEVAAGFTGRLIGLQSTQGKVVVEGFRYRSAD